MPVDEITAFYARHNLPAKVLIPERIGKQAERLAHFLASLAPDGPPAGMAPIGGRKLQAILTRAIGEMS